MNISDNTLEKENMDKIIDDLLDSLDNDDEILPRIVRI